MSSFDCIVIGSGHAGSCAALSAVQSGCTKVLIIDKCPPEWVGGNGFFTAGAHRTVHQGLKDLLPIVRNVSPEIAKTIDLDPYTHDHFASDIMRLGNGRSDPALVKAVVDESRDAIGWLSSDVGVPFTLAFNRQAYEVDGRQKFWGGLVLSVENGGKGLIAAHQAALKKSGVEVWFNTAAVELIVKDSRVYGVSAKRDGELVELTAPAVILAAGGFESSADLRANYLGPGWEKAKVRGTKYNTGDGFVMAKAIGARLTGDWEGCHSTAWDANAASDTGDRTLTNQFTKSGYPLGIMVDLKGERFVDEGEDFRNYTYAKFGRAILNQGGYAFQVWDSKVLHHLRKEEYGDEVVEKLVADSAESLADQLVKKGLENKAAFLHTISNFNEAVRCHQKEHLDSRWDPAIKDGLSTQSGTLQLPLPKSNWALTIDTAPLVAVKVCCGITFTFGGLAIDPETAGVISEDTGSPIEGLFCTGEMVGGLFYGNYPGGSGLTAGAVFGRKAGRGAAKVVRSFLCRSSTLPKLYLKKTMYHVHTHECTLVE